MLVTGPYPAAPGSVPGGSDTNTPLQLTVTVQRSQLENVTVS